MDDKWENAMPTMTKAGYVPPAEPKKLPPKTGGSKKKRRKKKKSGISAAVIVSLIVFLAACLVGAGTIYVYTQTQPYMNAFLPGTMLLGYPLGGATMEEAQALLDQITEEDVAGFKVELTFNDQSYALSAADVELAVDGENTLSPLWARGRKGGMLGCFAEMLRLRREPMIAQPIVTYDMAAADELFVLIEQDIACQPEDAQVTFTPGCAEPFVFTAEAIGYSIDLSGVRAQVEQAIASVEPTEITLEPQVIMPTMTLEDLQGAIVLRSRVLAEIDGDEATAVNVSLAAKALDGAVIAPGGTLSFNETVGARSAQRGYGIAPEPAYGDGVSGVGGGVCQLSSALYRLALLGGLDVTARSAAVYPVNYCEMGQEAAVSDQGIDLAVKNTTAYPIFLRARVYQEGGETRLDMQLIGEPIEGSYELVSGILEETNLTEPVYVRDHEGKYATYDDERVEAGEAKPGYKVVVDRVKLDGEGGEIARETISTDTYDAVPPAIYVGVKTRE